MQIYTTQSQIVIMLSISKTSRCEDFSQTLAAISALYPVVQLDEQIDTLLNPAKSSVITIIKE